MNIYECIYMVQMNDFTEMKNLIQYYRPMVTDIWADVFVRKANTILCEKEEFYRHADLLLYHCIFEYRMDREDTKLYYGDVNMFDSLEVHDVVLDKLMWEYTKNRINRVFGKDYVQIIDYRMEGYTLKNIAEELGLSASKVSFMFEKVKKWYTTIDS